MKYSLVLPLFFLCGCSGHRRNEHLACIGNGYEYQMESAGGISCADPVTHETYGVPRGVVIGVVTPHGLVKLQGKRLVMCESDNQLIEGDYVTISETIAGECHDSGMRARKDDR